jgi:hypothetical protein
MRRRPTAESLEGRNLLAVLFDLSELDAADGFVLHSAVPQDRAGFSVSGAGDVNGDGFDDLLVGAPVDPGFPAGNGQAYLIHGKQDGFGEAINLFELTGEGGSTIFGGNAEDHAGYSVSGAGDLNGDGLHDYLIGAAAADRFAQDGTLFDAGQTYAVFGSKDPPPAVVTELSGSAGFQLIGNAPFDRAGFSVSDAGDVNGDGYDDLILGAPAAPVQLPFVEGIGQAYLVYGSPTEFSSPRLVSLLFGETGVQMFGVNLGDRTGLSVSGIGDLNGDGFDDFAIGAPSADRAGDTGPLFGSGTTYIVFGGFDGMPVLANLDGTDGFRLEGLRPFDRSGFAVSSAGDINGDGFDDMVIGAPADFDIPVTAGESYVVFGKAQSYPARLNLGELEGSEGFVIQGIAALDHAGFSVSSAGDVNGDGLDDLIIGAPFADKQVGDETRFGTGESYVVFGRATEFPDRLILGLLEDDEGLIIRGDAAFDRVGYSVSSAGDVNGDGFDDILIGAPSDFGNSFRPGRSYVLFGRDFTGASPLTGDAGNNVLAGDEEANQILGGVGDDVLLGAGGADVLLGGQGNDAIEIVDLLFRRLDGGRGTDTLRLAADDLHLDLMSIPDNQLTGFEEIDLTGPGDQELTIGNVREALRISDTSNRLLIRRDLGDVVNIGDGWSRSGSEEIDEVAFSRFTQGAAELLVQSLPPQVDLNGTEDGSGFTAAFVEDVSPLAIVGADAVIFGDAPIVSARITLTNPSDGDDESLVLVTRSGVSASYDQLSATWTLTGSASAAEYAAVLKTLQYHNASQSPDEADRLVEIQVSDGLADSPLVVATVMITAVNDAPVLDAALTPSLTVIEEDASDPSGDTVAAIVVDGSITDPDGTAVEAIAVINAASTAGRWQYSTGGEWMDFDNPSDSAARLLGPEDRVRFLPAADFNGSVSLAYRAWDQTSGRAGDAADVRFNGGTTSFSADLDPATLSVTPVNDAPQLDPGFSPRLTTIFRNDVDSPGDSVSTIVIDRSMTDPDGAVFEAIAIVAVDEANGHWEHSADGTNWSRIRVSESAALLLGHDCRIRFVPDADFFGAASLTFRAWDRTSGTEGDLADVTQNGGTTAFSVDTDTATIDVLEIDHGPTIAPTLRPVILAPGISSQVVQLTEITDGGDATESLTVTAVSSDPSILPHPAVTYTSPESAGSLTLAPTGIADGWSIVTVTVAEADGDSISESFAVSVGVNPLVWQNPIDAFDINADTFVVPGDVLLIINELNDSKYSDRFGELLQPPPPGVPPPFFDINGDRFVAPGDALQLVNLLNRGASGEAESGGVGSASLLAVQFVMRAAPECEEADCLFSPVVPVAWGSAPSQPGSPSRSAALARQHDQSLRELTESTFELARLEETLNDLSNG